MSPISMPRTPARIEIGAIRHFMELVKRSSQARSRDVRLDLADATVLVAEMAVLLGHVMLMQDATADAQHNIKVDGGSLR